ncbi:MAG: hypothetical protein U0W24_19790 [Bacteroidales bacterium]
MLIQSETINLIEQKGLLLLGGAKRNVGKTTLLCRIIAHFSENHQIAALKIKTIYDGDDFFHGKNQSQAINEFILTKEDNAGTNEDTGKMLRAGAKEAYLLRAKSAFLKQGFEKFLSEISNQYLIICESNSLRLIVKPDLFLFVQDEAAVEIKPSALKLVHLADRIIISNGITHDFAPGNLNINNDRWEFREFKSENYGKF